MSSIRYKVGYLDEDEIWMALVRKKLSSDFDIYLIDIPITLEGIWDYIQNKKLDALVVDFQLFDSGKVAFDGNDVVQAITAHNQHFPIIVLTAHENRALDELDNVLIIKGKRMINDSNELPNFIKMLNALIKSYKTKLADSQQTVLELQKKDVLNEHEESILFNAQRFIAETCKDDTVSPNQFSIGYSKQLQELLDTANNLLNELKGQKQ
jgi:DNA-binding NarL/FixJ family response regulator